MILSSLEDSAAIFCFNEMILSDCFTNKTSHHKNCRTIYPTKTENMSVVRLDTIYLLLVKDLQESF